MKTHEAIGQKARRKTVERKDEASCLEETASEGHCRRGRFDDGSEMWVETEEEGFGGNESGLCSRALLITPHASCSSKVTARATSHSTLFERRQTSPPAVLFDVKR